MVEAFASTFFRPLGETLRRVDCDQARSSEIQIFAIVLSLVVRCQSTKHFIGAIHQKKTKFRRSTRDHSVEITFGRHSNEFHGRKCWHIDHLGKSICRRKTSCRKSECLDFQARVQRVSVVVRRSTPHGSSLCRITEVVMSYSTAESSRGITSW